MAFGFGFNKQKVLSAAEKYVQQGKMQNAIAEYEKVLKADPKDLTVTNTVGDLYSRLGEVDKATDCFKAVGDAYANQGFTVKAIAMYKKISKLKPSLESVLKLAELYTQQGLFNDARAQYLHVAEEFLKSGELDNAVRIFQKILEMDPENTNMRVRLAEVYVRLGKKDEAWKIFSAAAETLRSKGSLNGAEEVLQRMLTLDPGNSYALLLQARNLLETDDADAAIKSLQKISDLDSHPDGLRDLFKAYLKTGRLSDAGTLANKLQSVHNDLSAIASFADALMQAGQYENALLVYNQHADRMFAEDSGKVLKNLYSIIGHVRENPDSLQKLLALFQKAGDTTHISEVIELLAHASVQSGELAQARDLYQKLATMEPGNPLHMNNYQQVASQLGGSTSEKFISAEEAALIVDELEATAPSLHQHYSDAVALAVRSALTDAELFTSYNMPAKALGPLMAALPQAPTDLRLNQRLAALHTRAARFAEASVCCRTLQNLYSDAGYPEEATRYGELADRYEERSGTPAATDAAIGQPAATVESEAAEFSVAAPAAAPWPAAPPQAQEESEFAVVAGHDSHENDVPAIEAEASAAPAEIDLSEWDDSLTVETDAQPVEAESSEVAVPASKTHPSAPAAPDSDKLSETVEEVRFFLEHGMPEQASAAFTKVQSLTSDQAMLDALRAEIEAASQTSSVEEPSTLEAVEAVSEFTVDEPAAEFSIEPPAVVEQAPPAPVAKVAAPLEPPAPPVQHFEPPAMEEPPVPAPAPPPAPQVLQEFVSDLESSLGENFLPGAVPHEPSAPAAHASATPSSPVELEPIGNASPTTFGVPESQPLGEFVADIEASLGDDFLKGAPVPEPEPAVAPAPTRPAPAPVQPVAASPSPVVSAPAASNAAAAAASASAPVVSARVATPAPPAPPRPQAPQVVPGHAATKSSPFGDDAGVDLAEMFGELKHDLEAGATTSEEDPETHYNLGIAFREMGLLDEAIGELQKTCQSIDRGHPFPQAMQTYTWLAQCFLDKGVPEAAIRWYQKALTARAIDEETRTALYYELASAYETAGDKSSALKNFMEVYGRNIDYRDVAERIKALKS